MKKHKTIGNILFWLTLLSPMLSFILASLIGEFDIFGIAGMIRYSWVMWLFIPLGVLSALLGKKLKNGGQSYKKNYMIAFICIPLLIIFGSYRFIFNSISYDTDKVGIVESETGLDLPDRVKIATQPFDTYSISYLKIPDEKEKYSFEQEIKSNELWKDQLSSKIKSLLPVHVQYEVSGFDYFVFYNLTAHEYNLYPPDGEYDCVWVAYDREAGRIIIVDEWRIRLD